MTTEEAQRAGEAWGLADDKLTYAEEKWHLLNELVGEADDYVRRQLLKDMRIEAHKDVQGKRWRAARASALAQEAAELLEAKGEKG